MNHDVFKKQMILPELGVAGQEKLCKSSVVIVGAGALGCPVLQYLSAAGIRSITVVDDDKVGVSNLHRQVLYGVDDVGELKVDVAIRKLAVLHPWTQFYPVCERLTNNNAKDLFKHADLIIDCTDNFRTKYLINDVCVMLNKPFVGASIKGFGGQISVYNFQAGPDYRSLFPEPPVDATDCDTSGVLGAVPGVIGSLQAVEAIKVLAEIPGVLSGRFLQVDLLRGAFLTVEFASLKSSHKRATDDGQQSLLLKDAFLVDVREPWEHEERNAGGINIPLAELTDRTNELPDHLPIVLYCDSGKKAKMGATLLAESGLSATGTGMNDLLS